MGGNNPFIEDVDAKLPTSKYTVTFLPMGTKVEVDPADLPLGRDGLPGSILDIALGNDIDIHLALQQPLNVAVFTLDGILIGAGDLRYLAWAMAAAAAVFIPLTVLVLQLGGGAAWLMGAIWVLMGTRLIGMWLRYRTTAWIRTGAEV